MKHIILTLLFFGLTFSACKKKDIDFIMTGQVSALNNGANISNVSIQAYTSSLSNNLPKLVGTTTTDASGNYELKIERSKFELLTLKLNKDNYFEGIKTYSFDDLTTEQENETQHSLSPKAFTHFIVKSNTNNQLKIQKISGKTDCEACCANGIYLYEGPIDTIVSCANDGDTYMKFYWWKYGPGGNNVLANGVDSIYNNAFQTIDYNFDF